MELIYPRHWTIRAHPKDKKKVGHATRGSNKKKSFNSITQVLKKKVVLARKIEKPSMFKLLREQEASEKFTYHEQKDPPKDEDVLALVNTSIINMLIASSTWLNVVALDVKESKNFNEEL